MTTLYPQILAVHIIAVSLSGSLFALRGLAMMSGSTRGMSAWVRYFSYGIDTVLLIAALMLVVILPREVFVNHWLTVKLMLVVIYIVLGVLSLHRARTRWVRIASYVGALLVFGAIVGIARAHDPLGWLVWVRS